MTLAKGIRRARPVAPTGVVLRCNRADRFFGSSIISAVLLSGIGRHLDRIEYRGVIVLRLIDAGRNWPHRPIEQFGDIVAYPILGGLHHRYTRI